MQHGTVHDPSTLSSLHPSETREVHHKAYKNSIRMHGSHLMALSKPARAPEACRKYVHGDPVNLIDWKAFARTDQLMVREIRDEASAGDGRHLILLRAVS